MASVEYASKLVDWLEDDVVKTMDSGGGAKAMSYSIPPNAIIIYPVYLRVGVADDM